MIGTRRMALIAIQNIATFESLKRHNPAAYQRCVFGWEIGDRASSLVQERPGPPECEHDRLLTDDCDDCGRY